MDFEYPGFFARFYDLIYDRIRSEVDSQYYLGKILEAQGPALEIGVGTGRIFTEALNRGADIYGIDISPAMIDILKSRIDPCHHSRISIQNMLDFDMGRKFRLIIAPFRVFMHLMEVHEQVKALDHIHSQLEDGGRFIFDLFIPNPKILSDGLNDVLDFEGEYAPGETVKRYVSAHCDMISQVNHISMRFEWTEEGYSFSETWDSQMRLFYRYELEHLLGRSKFRETNIFGDYYENPLSEGSKDFVAVCRR